MESAEILRVFDEESLRRCLEIREKVFVMEKKVPKEVERDTYDRLEGRCDHFLIRNQGEDAGALRCLYIEENIVKIQRFCILREWRGKGVGKQAVKYIEKYYHSRNVKKIEMDAKYEAVGFYEACGYEKVSDIFIEADKKHITMRKNI
ncbi:GNAT family N-acetyltransferase [Mediterraneibacter massiliensis]|uniref:GNAT family N-acetyltransferase n=1 Tax=Mediterraneibacter massiliensis TaxID=1720300 RepID=UPI00073EA5EB|nr:GNAT family N-acetyltransferase [Mediterraneibacter massiliensis]